MLYRKTIIEEYIYASEEERVRHVAEKVSQGYVDSGPLKERMSQLTLLPSGNYPQWDNNPSDFTWYSKLIFNENPRQSSLAVGDYVQGTGYYAESIREDCGWVINISNTCVDIRADDEYEGARGTTLYFELGPIIKLPGKSPPD